MDKNQLDGFPEEIIEKMLENQQQQRGKANRKVLENNNLVGFSWVDSPEGHLFWERIIKHREFDRFFEKYPKQPKEKVTGKIIKYRSRNEEAARAAGHILIGEGFAYHKSRINEITMQAECSATKKLRDLKVLDTWFSPVYEEKEVKTMVPSVGGSFEVAIDGKGVRIEETGVRVDPEQIKGIIATIDSMPNLNVLGLDHGYIVSIPYINIGCKESIPVQRLREIVATYTCIKKEE